MNEIRLLTASEIDVRVQSLSYDSTKACFLLYKDARCDMAILDETFGAMNWQREHFIRENIIKGQRAMVNYCRVSIWDKEKGGWVSKEDVGVESNTENAKGESSDSFKRACVCWGIGRELYSAPSIWVNLIDTDFKQGSRDKLTLALSVKTIEYDDARNIKTLVLIDKHGNERYKFYSTPSAGKAAMNNNPSAPIDLTRAKENELMKSINAISGATDANDLMTRIKDASLNLRKAYNARVKEIGLVWDSINNMYIEL